MVSRRENGRLAVLKYGGARSATAMQRWIVDFFAPLTTTLNEAHIRMHTNRNSLFSIWLAFSGLLFWE